MTLKREIKDAYIEGGNSIYVKTHSNAVYVDENETETLTQRLDNVKDSITKHTSQMKHKANKYQIDIVEDFGIDNTGAEDCSIKINEAIAYAKTNNINAIYFKEGTYKLNSSIILDTDDMKLLGENCRKTIFLSNQPDIIMIDIQKGYRQTIENIGFKGGWSYTQTAIGKSTDNNTYTARQTFKHLYFNNITYGIKIDTGYMDSPLLLDLWFQTVKGCISLKHCEGGTIQKIVAEPFVNYVFKLYQPNGMTIRDVLANTSKDIYSKATTESYSCVAILFGSKGGAVNQTYGSSVSFDNVHSEYIHQFAFVSIPNVLFNGIYIYNGGNSQTTSQKRNTFHFSSSGGLTPNNCKLFNIKLEIPLKDVSVYDIFKGDFNEKTFLTSDGDTISTSIGSFDNLLVDGFNGTVSIPNKIADGVFATYTIKDEKYTLNNGSIYYESNKGIPDSINKFGITNWRDGDCITYKGEILYKYISNSILSKWSSMHKENIYHNGTTYNYTVNEDWSTFLITANAKSGTSAAGSLTCIIKSGNISAGDTNLLVTKLEENDPMSVSVAGNVVSITNRYNGHTIISVNKL